MGLWTNLLMDQDWMASKSERFQILRFSGALFSSHFLDFRVELSPTENSILFKVVSSHWSIIDLLCTPSVSRDQPPSCVNWPVAAGLHLGSSAASGDDWDATLVFTSQEEAGRFLQEIPKINTVAELQETHQKHFQQLHIFSAAYFLQWWTEVWKISYFLTDCWPTRCCWMEEKNQMSLFSSCHHSPKLLQYEPVYESQSCDVVCMCCLSKYSVYFCICVRRMQLALTVTPFASSALEYFPHNAKAVWCKLFCTVRVKRKSLIVLN